MQTITVSLIPIPEDQPMRELALRDWLETAFPALLAASLDCGGDAEERDPEVADDARALGLELLELYWQAIYALGAGESIQLEQRWDEGHTAMLARIVSAARGVSEEGRISKLAGEGFEDLGRELVRRVARG